MLKWFNVENLYEPVTWHVLFPERMIVDTIIVFMPHTPLEQLAYSNATIFL